MSNEYQQNIKALSKLFFEFYFEDDMDIDEISMNVEDMIISDFQDIKRTINIIEYLKYSPDNFNDEDYMDDEDYMTKEDYILYNHLVDDVSNYVKTIIKTA